MDVNCKICGSIESEIENRWLLVAMCFENQPRWRRLQATIVSLLRLKKFLVIDSGNEKILKIVVYAQKRCANGDTAALIARSTTDFQMNIYNKYATTYFFCRHISSRRHV